MSQTLITVALLRWTTYYPYNNEKSRPVQWDERAGMEELEMGEGSS